MKNIIPFDDFLIESYIPINEGLFDVIKNMVSKIVGLFTDPVVLNTKIESAVARLGVKAENNPAKMVRVGTTILVKLQSPSDETLKMVLSFTKISDLPDGSGLFQITGTDSPAFLKSMTIKDNTQLNILGVMAIIDPAGFVKGEPITMRVYKNVMPTGAPIITTNLVSSAVGADEIAKEGSPASKPAAPVATVTPGKVAV